MDLRVLFFATDVARQSGASYAMAETAKRVAARGVSTTVVVPDNEDSRIVFPESAFEVLYMPIRRLRRTANPAVQLPYLTSFGPTVVRLRRIIRDRNIGIVHVNEIMDLIGSLAGRLSGTGTVAHVRADGIPGPIRAPLVRALDRLVDQVVVPSQSTADWLGQARPGLCDKTHVVHDFAFDLDQYDSLTSGAAIRDELKIPASSPVALLISKLQVEKGHLFFLRAAKEVLKTRPDSVFVIVGGEVDGHPEDARAIRDLAATLPASSIRLVGTRSDLPQIYAASDVAVHCPVYPDTYPTVVLLAMLMGRPIIGSRIGGIPEQIADGKTGLLVPADDDVALARAITTLFDDRALRSRLASAGEAWCRTSFAPNAQADALLRIYGSLPRGGRSA